MYVRMSTSKICANICQNLSFNTCHICQFVTLNYAPIYVWISTSLNCANIRQCLYSRLWCRWSGAWGTRLLTQEGKAPQLWGNHCHQLSGRLHSQHWKKMAVTMSIIIDEGLSIYQEENTYSLLFWNSYRFMRFFHFSHYIYVIMHWIKR